MNVLFILNMNRDITRFSDRLKKIKRKDEYVK